VKLTHPRLLALAGAAALLTAAHHTTHSAGVMTQAANAFLASLGAEHKAKAHLKFEDDDRQYFHFVPNESIMQARGKSRLGLPMGEMLSHQRHLASALLAAGLSQSGYMKVTSIMSLEDVLRVLEDDQGGRRNPDKYHVTIFGEPSDTGAWSYRFEGHHVSLSFTIVNGKVAGSPAFLGSNPAEVRVGPRKGLRVLAAEEDLGRELVNSLNEEQKKDALVSATAYKDILTEASRNISTQGWPAGLGAAKMTPAQRDMLAKVAGAYIDNMTGDVAASRRAKLKAAGTNIQFAWAGGLKRGDPHYYRIAAPDFLIEYDNTQNEANHVHSVWREFNGDFGADLLKEHYRTSHRP
jgi:hypothetical protein